jgi:diacylglycerol kinase (ATP)
VRSLVFVVNPRSGGRRGTWLLSRLQERFPAERVIAIEDADLPALARVMGDRERGGLVACGGDGTAAAVIEACWLANPLKPVPVGTIPLGTGNDLARHLGWRPPKRTNPLTLLDHQIHALQVATLAALDRWVLTGNGLSQPFYNYLSLGSDARIAARFHALRGQHPWLFRSPAVNKAVYAFAALGEPGLGIQRLITFHDRPPLPTWTRALVLCNITSYAGGSSLGDDLRADDGWLDAFALGPLAATGCALSGVRRPRRIARGALLRFSLHEPVIAQLDGEPQRLLPGHYTVAHGGRARVITANG